MVAKHRIHTEHAPLAVGCYSQAIRSGNWVFLSGQIGLNPQTMQLVEGGVAAELEQIMRNIKAVLAAVGADLSHIVKVTVFLKDLGHYTILNETMEKYFNMPFPARSAVEVAGLPRGALIEIEAMAVI